MINKTILVSRKKPNKMDPSVIKYGCELDGERMCDDGTCVPTVDLCPEDEMMNENTVLIMIVVGLGIIMFMIFLYCFQQKQRRRQLNTASYPEDAVAGDDEAENASFFMPPPAYNEVISTDRFPPTPETLRQKRIQEAAAAITPPPNYDAALKILAQSHDCLSMSTSAAENLAVMRRSVSLDPISPQPRHRRSESDSPPPMVFVFR